MKKYIAAVLFSVFTAAQAAPTPVLVRLGDLAWVGAREGLPRISGGRVMVPPLAACDLLGLKCQVRGGSVDAAGPLGKLSVQLHQGFTELRPLTLITGQDIHFDPRSSAATVQVNPKWAGVAQATGTWAAPWLSIQHDVAATGQPAYDLPLKVQWGPVQRGKPNRTLTLSAASSLKGARLTLYSKTSSTVTRVGDLVPSTPDNPNTYSGCRAVCQLDAPRDALWVLGYLKK